MILIHLLELLSNESLGRYASKPKMRVQRFENVNISLDFIKRKTACYDEVEVRDFSASWNNGLALYVLAIMTLEIR